MTVRAAAVARQRRAVPAVWRADAQARPGGDWAELGGLQVHTTGLAPVHWNGAHLTDPSGLEHLDEAASWFATHDKPWGLLAPVELGARPPGLRHVHDQPVMLLDLADLRPGPGLPAQQAVDPQDVAPLQAECFEDPPDLALAFVAPKVASGLADVVVLREGARVVATATGVLVDGVVGVYGVATAPDARRRGLATGLVRAVLERARDRGADLAYLNPSELGRGAYASLGFADAPPWQVWVPD